MSRPMIRLFSLLLALAFVAGCAEPDAVEEIGTDALGENVEYASFGESVVLEDGMTTLDPAALTSDPLAYGGTVVRVEGTVAEVCKMAGCWLTLQTSEGSGGANPTAPPVRVQVPRDEAGEYVFTFPKDLGMVEAIVEGTVAVDTLGVDELRHYAEDEGRSAAEIDAITEPQPQIVLTARGALVKTPEATVQS